VLCIAGVVAVLAAETLWMHLPVYVWLPAGLFSILVGGVNLHHAEVSRANAKLRATQEEVERLAQTAERERIGRDLHDLLGHTLSLITLKAELARKLVPRDPQRAAGEMAELERISRDALREVRAVVSGYRSEGLAAELARARLALEAAGVKLEYLALPVDLDPARETVLAMALREAVTNLIRHAGASTCRIVLEPAGGEGGIRLEVHDDGGGAKAAGEGMGLSAMRDRVEGLGGEMERRSDGGTAIVITLPPRPARAASPAPSHGGLAVEGGR
jgi:two-component system sensor histidine kinase DesK